MLHAALVAMLAAAPIAGSAQTLPSLPTMSIRVAAAPDITPTLVTALLAETDAVWRGTGISFLWQRDSLAGVASISAAARLASVQGRPESPSFGPSTLHVTIGHDKHHVVEAHLPLGWIVFDDPTTPQQEISVSYDNAMTLLERSSGVVGVMATMPRLQRETLLARAMGRALAHELGHYLSASKAHSKAGLMRAVQTAFELFSNERSQFRVTRPDRERMLARITSIYMASRG
jgi:hypothetical protein